LKRLRIVLHSNYLYLVLILILVLYLLINLNKDYESKININSNTFTGVVTNYKIKENGITLEIKSNEKIVAYYDKNIDIRLGDKVYLEGKFNYPKNNTIPNLFNYKKYLRNKKIYMTMYISKIKVIGHNNNLIYGIRNNIIKHISKYKSKAYLNTFIIGNKDYIDNTSYRSNGISHLLAISGMHISLLSILLISLFKRLKFNENKSLIIISIFLFFYMALTSFMPSCTRSVLLFSLITLNRVLNLDIKTIKLFLLTFIILLFINPFYIFDIGFIYSFTISFYLILFKDKLKKDNYFKSLLYISFLCFFISLPITLYNSYEVNFLSIFLNILFVPFVSFIVFPLSILTFIFPFLDSLFLILTNILEYLSNYFSSINLFTITFGKVNVYFIIFYYLLLTLFLYFNKKKYFFLILLLLFIQYNKDYIFKNTYLISIDVGQGDSLLLHKNDKNILIDTGGLYSKELAIDSLIPLFKSLGIRKINYLILSHGDFDHMGEAINLVNNYKVEKVIFNCGPYNDLEKELIKVLDRKKIKYYLCIKELNIDKNKLYFLQTKEYDNENDNSNVIYTELNGYKFMFMGDASITTEKEILNEYNLPDIDVLKVGHHGSKTSSGKEFIDEINPEYSIISIGNNNRYGHPNKEVLDNLDKSKIYRTDEDGSIMFKIKNNKLKIETCSP